MNDRHGIVRKAGVEVSNALLDAIKKYDLSYGEVFSILSEDIRRWAGYLRKDEQGEEE